MTSGIVLGIGLCFHNHAPQQTSIRLAFHQPAAHQIGAHHLGWAAKEGRGQEFGNSDDDPSDLENTLVNFKLRSYHLTATFENK